MAVDEAAPGRTDDDVKGELSQNAEMSLATTLDRSAANVNSDDEDVNV